MAGLGRSQERFELMQYVAFISRLALAATFVAASIAKAANFAGFTLTVRTLLGLVSPRLTRRRLGASTAVAVVLAEGCIGVLVASGFAPIEAATASIALIGIFALAAVVVVSRGARLECNCFGGRESVLGHATLARALLLVAAVAMYVVAAERTSPAWWPAGPMSGATAFGLTCAAILGARWLLAAPALYRLRRTRLEGFGSSQVARPHAIRVVPHSTPR